MKIISNQILSYFQTYKGIDFDCGIDIIDDTYYVYFRASTGKKFITWYIDENIGTFDLDRFITNLDREVQACFLI